MWWSAGKTSCQGLGLNEVLKEERRLFLLLGNGSPRGLDYGLNPTEKQTSLREVAREMRENCQVARGMQGKFLQFKHFVSSWMWWPAPTVLAFLLLGVVRCL